MRSLLPLLLLGATAATSQLRAEPRKLSLDADASQAPGVVFCNLMPESSSYQVVLNQTINSDLRLTYDLGYRSFERCAHMDYLPPGSWVATLQNTAGVVMDTIASWTPSSTNTMNLLLAVPNGNIAGRGSLISLKNQANLPTPSRSVAYVVMGNAARGVSSVGYTVDGVNQGSLSQNQWTYRPVSLNHANTTFNGGYRWSSGSTVHTVEEGFTVQSSDHQAVFVLALTGNGNTGSRSYDTWFYDPYSASSSTWVSATALAVVAVAMGALAW
jgi:hypothetical protein